jgi:D-lactate dehydrogenase (cytochrome)
VEEIRCLLGEDSVSTEDEVLHQHGYSPWSTSNVDRLPIAVVYPKNTHEVSQAVRICHKYRVPMSMSLLLVLAFIVDGVQADTAAGTR